MTMVTGPRRTSIPSAGRWSPWNSRASTVLHLFPFILSFILCVGLSSRLVAHPPSCLTHPPTLSVPLHLSLSIPHTGTNEAYRKTHMPLVHKQLKTWQRELVGEPWDLTLIRLAMFRQRLTTTSIVVETDVKPAMLMKTDYLYSVSATRQSPVLKSNE